MYNYNYKFREGVALSTSKLQDLATTWCYLFHCLDQSHFGLIFFVDLVVHRDMFRRGDDLSDSDLASSSEESPAAQRDEISSCSDCSDECPDECPEESVEECAEECPEPGSEADIDLSVNSKLPHVQGFVRFFRFIRNDLAGSEFLRPGGARMAAACSQRWKALDSDTQRCYDPPWVKAGNSPTNEAKMAKTAKTAKPAKAAKPAAKPAAKAKARAKAKAKAKTAKAKVQNAAAKSKKATANDFLMQLSVSALRGKLRYYGVSAAEINQCIEKTELVSLLKSLKNSRGKVWGLHTPSQSSGA